MKKLMIVTVMAVTTAFAAPASADSEEAIELLQGYLELSEQYVDLTNRKDASVFFAVEGIVEIHEARGEQAKAIPILQGVLEQFPENQAVRNLVRFKLRDLYRETGQTEQALAELQRVIEENR